MSWAAEFVGGAIIALSAGGMGHLIGARSTNRLNTAKASESVVTSALNLVGKLQQQIDELQDQITEMKAEAVELKTKIYNLELQLKERD